MAFLRTVQVGTVLALFAVGLQALCVSKAKKDAACTEAVTGRRPEIFVFYSGNDATL
jgi:hypothetical protein